MYETVPPEPTDDDSRTIYSLIPEHTQDRTPEEVEELRERRKRERGGRYRRVCGLLGLRVVAHREGTLQLT